jgi:hypothetical protein
VIPTLLIVGVVLGVLVHDTRSLALSTGLVTAAAVAWGLFGGIDASSPGIAVGGGALGLANIVVGALAGWAVHGVARTVKLERVDAGRR